MGETAALLKQLDISFETKIVSAHRTPKRLYNYLIVLMLTLTFRKFMVMMETFGFKPRRCCITETPSRSLQGIMGCIYSYAEEAQERGIKVIIAGAGGAAHLPGMTAAMTHLPVLGVPVQSKALSGQDSLLSIVQMPAGIPVMTLAIGVAGAKNAALSAASILSLSDEGIRERLQAFRANQTQTVLDAELPEA